MSQSLSADPAAEFKAAFGLGGDAAPSEATLKLGRGLAGFKWGAIPESGKSKVGARLIKDEEGNIDRLILSGRPAGKHSGKQGQHTTAFSVVQEGVAAATIGRTEAQAKEALRLLFVALGQFPAFRGDGKQPPPPAELATLCQDLADANSAKFKAATVAELTKSYIELRDAIPGSSLATGPGGTAPGASPKSVWGHSEAISLDWLRDKETWNPSDLEPDEIADMMLKLYDHSSEQAGGLTKVDIAAQRETFVRSICQAFPGLAAAGGNALLRDVLALEPALGGSGDDDAMDTEPALPPDLTELASQLAAGRQDYERLPCSDFTCELIDGRMKFVGRPAGTFKGDSGQMGDHTCSMLMMQDAATGLFLTPDGQIKSADQIKQVVQSIKNQFAPQHYDFLGPIPDSVADRLAAGGERKKRSEMNRYEKAEDDEIEEYYNSDLGQYRQRHVVVEKHLDALDASAARLTSGQAVPADVLADLAVKYMELVDNRPSAVCFGGLAKGHGEARVKEVITSLSTLQKSEAQTTALGGANGESRVGETAAEAKVRFKAEKADTLSALLGLFDIAAARTAESALLEEHGGEEKGAEELNLYCDTIVGELIFFLSNAYPKCMEFLYSPKGDPYTPRSLALALRLRIFPESERYKPRQSTRSGDKRGRGGASESDAKRQRTAT